MRPTGGERLAESAGRGARAAPERSRAQSNGRSACDLPKGLPPKQHAAVVTECQRLSASRRQTISRRANSVELPRRKRWLRSTRSIHERNGSTDTAISTG